MAPGLARAERAPSAARGVRRGRAGALLGLGLACAVLARAARQRPCWAGCRGAPGRGEPRTARAPRGASPSDEEVQAQVSEAEALLREAREARAQAEALRREAREAEEARTQAAGADALLRQAQEARDRAARDLARARGAGGGAAAGAEAQGRVSPAPTWQPPDDLQDEEARQLLAQAEALRREAAAEEESLRRERSLRPEEEQGGGAAGCGDAAAAAAAGDCASCGSASSCGSKGGADATAPVDEQELARRALQALGRPASTTAWVEVATPGGSSELQWRELANTIGEMTTSQKLRANQAMGDQGRRMLHAMREGKAPDEGVFVVAGRRVRISADEVYFKSSFSRFPRDPVNGFSDEKARRMGRDCIVWKTFDDGTFTALFVDGSQIDFPCESVEGFDFRGSHYVG